VSSDYFSEKVKAFVRDNIHSVEQLEVLLLLFTRADKSWTAAEVSAEIRSSVGSVTSRLNDLRRAKLICCSNETAGLYQFSNDQPELTSVVSELADMYLVRRTGIIDMIFSKPIDKMKTFAEAFKLREEK